MSFSAKPPVDAGRGARLMLDAVSVSDDKPGDEWAEDTLDADAGGGRLSYLGRTGSCMANSSAIAMR